MNLCNQLIRLVVDWLQSQRSFLTILPLPIWSIDLSVDCWDMRLKPCCEFKKQNSMQSVFWFHPLRSFNIQHRLNVHDGIVLPCLFVTAAISQILTSPQLFCFERSHLNVPSWHWFSKLFSFGEFSLSFWSVQQFYIDLHFSFPFKIFMHIPKDNRSPKRMVGDLSF